MEWLSLVVIAALFIGSIIRAMNRRRNGVYLEGPEAIRRSAAYHWEQRERTSGRIEQ